MREIFTPLTFVLKLLELIIVLEDVKLGILCGIFGGILSGACHVSINPRQPTFSLPALDLRLSNSLCICHTTRDFSKISLLSLSLTLSPQFSWNAKSLSLSMRTCPETLNISLSVSTWPSTWPTTEHKIPYLHLIIIPYGIYKGSKNTL
jgi:hypothetical protein